MNGSANGGTSADHPYLTVPSHVGAAENAAIIEHIFEH
jgi:hypothetical protein